jgi:hypothetical protein
MEKALKIILSGLMLAALSACADGPDDSSDNPDSSSASQGSGSKGSSKEASRPPSAAESLRLPVRELAACREALGREALSEAECAQALAYRSIRGLYER